MPKKLSAREYLELSAIELLSRNTVEKITVRDICANCGISTRTFYKFFRDKYEIINTCFCSRFSEFFTLYEGRITLHNFMLFTAGLVCGNQAFFRHVFRYSGQNNIRISLVEPILAQYLRIIREAYHTEPAPELIDAATFFIRGQLSYVEQSLMAVEVPSAESSVKYFENALPRRLEPFLN